MPGDAPEYLILTDGKTHLSEIGDWSYPAVDASVAWLPGDWKTYDLASSENEFMEGFDVTTKPVERLELSCDIFLAEGRGATSRHRDLVTYDAVRLLRPAPEMKPDWCQRVED